MASGAVNGAPIRVMIVDDAVVVRHVLTDTLSKDPAIEIVGVAPDGKAALEKLSEYRPHVMVLDVEMPNMNGIETLGHVKKRFPEIKVIMFSTLTSSGAAATMDALLAGADEYVTKPSSVGSMAAAAEMITADLIPKIKALGRAAGSRTGAAGAASAARQPLSAATRFNAPIKTKQEVGAKPVVQPTGQIRPPVNSSAPSNIVKPPVAASPISSAGGRDLRPQVIAIAVSTGGPNALNELIPALPGDLPVPIVIVQHIPPVFSRTLAERLNMKSALTVAECEEGVEIRPGQVWIAPGDYHMTVVRSGTSVKLATNQNPPENSCRPAADVLFRSVAATYGRTALGVVLTGMGSDGLKGSQALLEAGGRVIAQDEASSVVWGMPGAVVGAGLAEAVLPLRAIANEIVNRVCRTAPAGTTSAARQGR